MVAIRSGGLVAFLFHDIYLCLDRSSLNGRIKAGRSSAATAECVKGICAIPVNCPASGPLENNCRRLMRMWMCMCS